MLGLNMLDVLIGLVFIFFLMSMTCSAIMEGIATYLRWRSNNLCSGVHSLLEKGSLSTTGDKSVTMAAFKHHPLIASSVKRPEDWPAYLPASNFATTLLDLVADQTKPSAHRRTFWAIRDVVLANDPSRDGGAAGAAEKDADGQVSLLLNVNDTDPVNQLNLGASEHAHLQAMLQSFIEDVTARVPDSTPGVDTVRLDALRARIEHWFDDTMDRASGWYKRRLQKWIFVVALALTAFLNVDTITIAQHLATDKASRDQLVVLAQNETSQPQAPATKEPETPEQIKVRNDKLKANLQGVAAAGLPIGWTSQVYTGGLWFWPSKFGGLLITVFAVSLGAPFWFDILSKLVNLRTAGVKPAKSDADTTINLGDAGTDQGGGGTASSGGTSSPGGGPTTSGDDQPTLPTDYWSRPDRKKDVARFDAGPKNLVGDNDPTPPPLNRTTFRAANAAFLARAALLAYQPRISIEQTLSQVWGVSGPAVKVFENKGQQAFAAVFDSFILVSFRGTVPSVLQTVIADARIALIKPVGSVIGMVHCGFNDAMSCLAADDAAGYKGIDDFLKPHLATTPTKPVFITGHSLGAAMATLFAARMIAAGQATRIGGLYTFGCPRVGDTTFVKWVNAALAFRAFRFVNDQDIVTRVAPREFGYDHTDRILYLNTNGTMDDNSAGWVRFLNTVIDAANDFRKAAKDQVGDHGMENYVRKIDNLASN